MSKISFDMRTRLFLLLIMLLISTPSMASANPILISFGIISALVGATTGSVTYMIAAHLDSYTLTTLLTSTVSGIMVGTGALTWMVYKLREH